MKDFHFSKKFLNKDGYLGIAAIMTSITFSSQDRMWHTFELKMSDCRNEINLDLTLEDEGNNNFENSCHKVDTLIQELTTLRATMNVAKIEYDRRKAVLEAKKAERAAEREGKKESSSSILQELIDESDNGISNSPA
jgi:hypothetical protein